MENRVGGWEKKLPVERQVQPLAECCAAIEGFGRIGRDPAHHVEGVLPRLFSAEPKVFDDPLGHLPLDQVIIRWDRVVLRVISVPGLVGLLNNVQDGDDLAGIRPAGNVVLL